MNWNSPTKYISGKFTCKLDINKCSSNQKWDNKWGEWKNLKNTMDVKKKKLNPSTCTCENCKCLEGIIGDSAITCDKITEVAKTVLTKTIPTKTIRFIKKKKR